MSATIQAPSAPAQLRSSLGPLEQFAPGAVLTDRYELVRELGLGAHGAVWKALDRHVDDFVALKVLRHVREDDLLLFRRELSAARRVTHPGVVRMHDLVAVGGAWALSMEFVDGESLERLIERTAAQGGLDKVRVHQLALHLAEALAAAHAAEVTHRDLKPANILVRKDGRPVITDFGISRVTRRESATSEAASGQGLGNSLRLTREGAILGTPLYMAPEQLEGRADVTQSVDLYAWALIVHELATSRVPHEAETLLEVKKRRLSEPVPLLDESVASPELRDAVSRCLSRAPSDRPRDGAALVKLLLPDPTPRTTSIAPNRARWGARVLVAIAIIGGVIALAVSLQREKPAASVPVVEAERATASAARPIRVHSFRNARKLTFEPGCSEYGSFSPDGKYVLFDKSEGPKSHLFQLELATGREERLTTSPRWDYSASYTPNGRSVLFLRQAQQPAAMLLELQTGKLRELASGAIRPTIGLDGRSFWAGDPATPTRFDLDSGALLEQLVAPVGMQALRVRTLASGEHVGVFRVGDNEASLIAVFKEGAWSTLRTGRFYDTLTLSADQSTAYFFSEKGPHDRTVTAFRPGAELVERQMMSHADLAFSADETSALWSTCRNQTTWAVHDGHGFRAPSEDPNFSGVDVALLDGRTIAISARDGADNKLWMMKPGSPPTELRGVEGVPGELHADGTAAIVATQRGLYRVDFATGSPIVTQLTSNAADVAPSTDNKGNVVFARQVEGGRSMLMSVPKTGGTEATPRWSGEAIWPTASPSADAIIFVDRAGVLMKLSGDTALPFGKDLPPGPYRRPMFSLDGRKVAVLRDADKVAVLDAATGRLVDSYDAGDYALHQVFFDRAGSLHVLWSTWVGDLWIADVVPE